MKNKKIKFGGSQSKLIDTKFIKQYRKNSIQRFIFDFDSIFLNILFFSCLQRFIRFLRQPCLKNDEKDKFIDTKYCNEATK